jgi:hypothetical protein
VKTRRRDHLLWGDEVSLHDPLHSHVSTEKLASLADISLNRYP